MEPPDFWKGKLDDVARCVEGVKRGKVRTIAQSPGKRDVFLVSYGPCVDLQSQATYSSACGAGNPAWYAHKPHRTPPTLFLIGPVHGQEVEGIVGLVNFINVMEKGRDLRGRKWDRLAADAAQTRLLIIPCANPDGRARCTFDSFVGETQATMAHWGQGSRADETDYAWPGVKTRMPMVEDVGFLGAYHNDDGINIVHEDFFSPTADETKAILSIARKEAPDYIAVLHSHGGEPRPLPVAYVPRFIKEKVKQFCDQLADRYESEGLPFRRPEEIKEDGIEFPPPAFNLISALHHTCGAMPFTFECPHGLSDEQYPHVTHDQILDIQLILYEELFKFALEDPVCWER
jgi:hypothetical protein